MTAEPDILLQSIANRVYDHLRPVIEAEVDRLVSERLASLPLEEPGPEDQGSGSGPDVLR